jgi:hypothetical protein
MGGITSLRVALPQFAGPIHRPSLIGARRAPRSNGTAPTASPTFRTAANSWAARLRRLESVLHPGVMVRYVRAEIRAQPGGFACSMDASVYLEMSWLNEARRQLAEEK